MRITPDHVDHYESHGYVLVEPFLTPAELDGALADFEAVLPGWVGHAADPTGARPKYWDTPYPGQRGIVHFPYPGGTLNALTFHPELRRFARERAAGHDVLCEQSHLSYKTRGSRGDQEQWHHLDYLNHTIAYPPRDRRYWQTAFLYYFTDVTDETAPTAVCSWQYTPEPILWPTTFSREQRPELYAHEVRVNAPAGSLLIYSMRTFHRGTAFTADRGRLGMFVTYKAAGQPWAGIVGWSQEGPRPELRDFMTSADVDARTALGFPAPGDRYWTDETLAGVAARYPDMDMTPYRAAVARKD